MNKWEKKLVQIEFEGGGSPSFLHDQKLIQLLFWFHLMTTHYL
jgi:hypothetical protein